MSENSSPIIEIKDLYFEYDRGPVLSNVNATVLPLDFVSVIGPNGGGKSTFIKLLLGELKPQRGSIRILGVPPGQQLERIGYMAQNMAHDLQFPVNVMDVVLMGRLHHRHFFGRYDAEDRTVADRALTEVGMLDLAGEPFSGLSGGQRQRVLIARSLVSEPDLLLLDEPTSNIDIAVEREFYELLKKLNEKMTIVVVSHDLGFVSKYVKNIFCVNREVHIHPAADMSEQEISEIYGMEMQLVRHDHAEEGHSHE